MQGSPQPKITRKYKMTSNFVLFTFLAIFSKFIFIEKFKCDFGWGDPCISYYYTALWYAVLYCSRLRKIIIDINQKGSV